MADEKVTEEEGREPKEPRTFSRRRFLFGSGLAVSGAVAAAVAGSTLAPTKAEAEGVATTVAPATPQVITVNLETGPLQKAMGYVSYDPTNCAGCRTCMAVCSLYHDGVVNPELARIQVTAPVLKTFEAQGITCKQCEGPECLWACPTGALHVDAQTGARVIDPNVCIGCQRCIGACPQFPNSPIRFDATNKKSLKCDLCDGDPQCVKFCPKSVSLTPHLYPEKDRVLKFVKTQEA
jgi:Fe-S-cluster-containing hydrogenase component 2